MKTHRRQFLNYATASGLLSAGPRSVWSAATTVSRKNRLATRGSFVAVRVLAAAHDHSSGKTGKTSNKSGRGGSFLVRG